MQVQRQTIGTAPLVGGTAGLPSRQTAPVAPPAAAPASSKPTECKDNCNVAGSKTASAKDCVDFIPNQPSRIFYINGIRTPEASAQEAVDVLKAKTNQEIQLIYNPTEGLISDTAEALANLTGINTGISRKVQNQLRSSLDKGEKVQIFAHSQGAAIAADALHKIADAWRDEGVTRKEISRRLSQVEVVGFGGFTLEKNFPKEVEVELHRKPKDYIPKFASALCEVGDAVKSKEKDLGKSLARLGSTVSGFVGVNTTQAIKFLAERPDKKSTAVGKPDFKAICKAVGQAVGSDHDMVVKNDFIRQEYSAGYLDGYAPKAKPVA